LVWILSKNKNKFWSGCGERRTCLVLWYTPAILATQEVEIRRIMVQGKPRQKTRPYFQNTQQKKSVVRVAHVVEYMPSKCEALSSLLYTVGVSVN
jgi:hypothetical protein